MQSSTRTALKLAPGATDADGATALAKGGHKLTMRDLEKSDPGFLLYLKKEQPATYAQLYKDAYGKEPEAPKKGAQAAAGKLGYSVDSAIKLAEKAVPVVKKLQAAGDVAGADLVIGAVREQLGLAAKPGAGAAPGLTLRQLEVENPNEVLRLRREAPAEYARLYKAQYGVEPKL